ncbi:NTP transferase domain-containing protein [Salinigranum sp. GCM10025319]|uniref:NTP transferase domain-containing protein n=1 Tax=Salinigranum sp. GCM10025319 TaxID=3252687 RepID=UPI00361CAD31
MTPPAPAIPALVLCGGRGTRLESEAEKPLVAVCGEPMLDRVVRALRASQVSAVHAVTSTHAPETRARATDLGLDVIDAPGEGYVADLRYALDVVNPPVLTVVADLPHLGPDHVDRALVDASRVAVPDDAEDAENTEDADAEDAGSSDTPTSLASLTVCVPVSLKRRLGASVDTEFEHEDRAVAPTGLNVVGVGGDGTETVSVVGDERLAVNVNRPRDREVAESLCD